MSKDRLAVSLERGAIVIRLPLSILTIAFEAAPFNEQPDGSGLSLYRVADVNAFAEAIVEELDREEEDGATPVHRLFDGAMEEAVENGCEGIEEISAGEKDGGTP
ncbi:MAG TPA: hypothetical protein DCQ64_25400 [Candidatus Rokubacteria bacterium]|nr:hypothetical protein [Candidatus Rokubacteria bacterium]